MKERALVVSWRDGTAGRMLASHAAGPGSVPGTLCGSQASPGVIPDYRAKSKFQELPDVTPKQKTTNKDQ